MSITGLQQGYQSGEYSVADMAQEYLRRIDRRNPELNAFLTITREAALADAAAAGSASGPLREVPVAYKDLFATAGIRTTNGSAFERQHVPDADAPIVSEMRCAGAVNVGKTNLHEYAFGITSNNPHYGPVRNPWNEQVTPGGSAAAVAANLCAVAMGTDTVGSIRIPASSCGVVGLKPTRGLLRRDGVTPLSWTLDHVGSLTGTVADMFDVMKVFLGETIGRYRRTDIRGLRVGVPRTAGMTRWRGRMFGGISQVGPQRVGRIRAWTGHQFVWQPGG